MSKNTKNVLILCTGNSARSIMAEALLNQWGAGRWRACSAGSRPTGRVHPLALEQIAKLGSNTSHFRSKSWDEFAQPTSPVMDWVITVCDNAAGETCPLWPGSPLRVHWGFADPAAVTGDENTCRAAFKTIFNQIQDRVLKLCDVPFDDLNQVDLQEALQALSKPCV
jgi:arsenate reductase (thioredoxin)